MTAINWTRVDNDTNGNPRYVCHFLALCTPAELAATGVDWIPVSVKYERAVNRSKRIGGRKYAAKSYGGGIVFQSYNLSETERAIAELLAKETTA